MSSRIPIEIGSGIKALKSSGAAFFIHAKPLSAIYRAKFIELLKKEGLVVPACVWEPDWVVDCRCVGNGKLKLSSFQS